MARFDRRGKPLTWGQRAKKMMADCPKLCEVAGLPPLSPVVVFFSALAMIDKHSALMSASARHKALIASADFVRSQNLDEAGAMQSIFDDFARQAADGELDYLTPLDLLKGAASRSNRAIEVGLSSVDIVLESLLSAIETTLPVGDLADEPPPPTPPPPPDEKYAVVIEGPGFSHDGNRYATLEIAQRAVRYLQCEIRGEDYVLDFNAKPFGITPPPEWRSATRIYIKEL